MCLCFAWDNPFNLNDKIHIGIPGKKVVWLALSIDVENTVKHLAFYFLFYSLIVQHKVNDSPILPL